jgi:hypothetical protein
MRGILREAVAECERLPRGAADSLDNLNVEEWTER